MTWRWRGQARTAGSTRCTAILATTTWRASRRSRYGKGGNEATIRVPPRRPSIRVSSLTTICHRSSRNRNPTCRKNHRWPMPMSAAMNPALPRSGVKFQRGRSTVTVSSRSWFSMRSDKHGLTGAAFVGFAGVALAAEWGPATRRSRCTAGSATRVSDGVGALSFGVYIACVGCIKLFCCDFVAMVILRVCLCVSVLWWHLLGGNGWCTDGCSYCLCIVVLWLIMT